MVKTRERWAGGAGRNKHWSLPAYSHLAEYLANLPPNSQTVNTSFVERANLTMRQQSQPLDAQNERAFSKVAALVGEGQLWLAVAYYHLVLPHESLRGR